MAIRETRNAENEETGEEEEKWITHYSSNHKILLVGEGDFSFSLCLANAFASASNICASSLDSYGGNAKSNLEKLEKLGACLLHGVDATKMKHHSYLANRKFDRIIFNFPHAGFYRKEDNAHMIQMHKNLVQGFFRSASNMLRTNGEIHVNHKTSTPYCLWNLEKLASESSLALIQRLDFNIENYPGYHNKRGNGSRCDEPFSLGECSTFKFIYRVLDRNGLVRTYPRNSYGVAHHERSRSDFDAKYYGLGRVRHGLVRQRVEVPRTSNGVEEGKVAKMLRRVSTLGRPSGYQKVARTKSILRLFFVVQAITLLLQLILLIFRSASEGLAPRGLEIATTTCGFISLMIGELGRKPDQVNVLRFFMASSSFAVSILIFCAVRKYSGFMAAKSPSYWEIILELPGVALAVVGLVFHLFIIGYTIQHIANIMSLLAKRAS